MGAGDRIVAWLDDVWSQTAAVQVVDGGEDDGPVSGRVVLVELPIAVSDALRGVSTTGRFTGDICRCHGGPTLVLRDGAGQVLAGASVHGYGRLGWNRATFRNDLIVADATGLHLLLAAHGVAGQIGSFLAPLTERLDLHEGEPQFRPAGQAGRVGLAERGVPDILQTALVTLTGQQAGDLSAAQVADLRRLLTVAIPAPIDRATVLLSWLGRLTVPAEALWGEGALVRRLLADLSQPDLVTAAAMTRTAAVAMGLVNLAIHIRDDTALATAVDPTLRRLLPPATATENVR